MVDVPNAVRSCTTINSRPKSSHNVLPILFRSHLRINVRTHHLLRTLQCHLRSVLLVITTLSEQPHQVAHADSGQELLQFHSQIPA